MSSTSERIWYGDSPPPPEGPHPWGPRLAIAALFAALVALRLALPFAPTDSLFVYDKIAWAILHQENWGKQALVGVIEYPPLPTVCLLLFSPLQRLGENLPGHLLIAVAQVWSLFYLARTVLLFLPWRIMAFMAIFLLPLPVIGSLIPVPLAPWVALDPEVLGRLWDADPFWIEVVLLCSVLFHACRWERHQSMRDLVVIALNCGLLVFCGLPGLLFALAIVAAVWLHVRNPLLRSQGGEALLLMPLAYTAILYPLFNWLIMGDWLFFLRRLRPWFESQTCFGNLTELGLPTLALIGLGGLALTVGVVLPRVPLYLRMACLLTLALLATALTRIGGECFIGGEFLASGFIGVLVAVYALFGLSGLDRSLSPLSRVVMLPVSLLLLLTVSQLRHDANRRESFRTDSPPAANRLLAQVDRHWAQSRLLLYDLRSAALYCDQSPPRFVANLDFNAAIFRELREKEQMHLLVPPNNGLFYSPHDPVLAYFHQRGYEDERLFLEESWRSGWQLWRCIRPER